MQLPQNEQVGGRRELRFEELILIATRKPGQYLQQRDVTGIIRSTLDRQDKRFVFTFLVGCDQVSNGTLVQLSDSRIRTWRRDHR